MNDIDIDELRAWLREAGVIAQAHFRQVVGWRKADRSWVTEADQAIERMLGERLAARYPGYGVIGEEQTRRETEAEFLWALDPIDGTASFVAGLPMWSISLGLLRHGLPVLGLVYLPLLDDCYWAGPEGPALSEWAAHPGGRAARLGERGLDRGSVEQPPPLYDRLQG